MFAALLSELLSLFSRVQSCVLLFNCEGKESIGSVTDAEKERWSTAHGDAQELA